MIRAEVKQEGQTRSGAVLWLSIMLSLFPLCLPARGVLLAWDEPPPSVWVDGYYIYVVDRGQTNVLDVGNVLLAPLPNLIPGETYTIYVTSWNLYGEGPPSLPVTYTPPLGAVPPVIGTQPRPQKVVVGQEVVLSVTASGTEPLRFDWFHDGEELQLGTNTSIVTIPSASVQNSGEYWVRISNPVGVVTSRVARVTISPPALPPVITRPLGLVNITEGSRANLVVEYGGSPPFYFQWYKNGVPIARGTNDFHSVRNATDADEGIYSVRVMNEEGFVETQGQLNVVPVSTALPPVILRPPLSATVEQGESITLDVVASGIGPLTYQWFKDGVALTRETTRTLTLQQAGFATPGRYSVVVSNAVGSVTSVEAVVTVAFRPPVITRQPYSVNGYLGTPVYLSVEAEGGKPLSYQWYKENQRIQGGNAAALEIEGLASEQGRYFVVVTNISGVVTSAVAHVFILEDTEEAPPEIITQPMARAISGGAELLIELQATSLTSLSYQWILNDQEIPGQTGPSLRLTNLDKSGEGEYQVRLANAGGVIFSAPVQVKVHQAPPPGTPLNVTAGLLTSATLSAPGPFSPTATYRWFRNGQPIAPSAGYNLNLSPVSESHAGDYVVETTDAGVTSVSGPIRLRVVVPPFLHSWSSDVDVPQNAPVLLQVNASPAGVKYQWFHNGEEIDGGDLPFISIPAATFQDAGTYYVRISNEAGFIASPIIRVNVRAAPRILEQDWKTMAIVGQPFSLSLEAIGPEPLSYEWMKDGVVVAVTSEPVYTIDSVTLTNQGLYNVVVRNAYGSASGTNAMIRVVEAPALTPESATLDEGSSITLALDPQFNPSGWSLQWYKDGVPLPGRTATNLQLTAASPDDAGSYHVVLGNSAGFVRSHSALLNVRTAPRIVSQVRDIVAMEGSNVSLDVQVEGENLSMRWRKDGWLVPGVAGPSLDFRGVSLEDAGKYRLVVVNDVGSAASQDISLTVVASAPLVLARQAGDSFEILAESVPHALFELQATSGLHADDWISFGRFRADDNGHLQILLPRGFEPGRFFRLKRE